MRNIFITLVLSVLVTGGGCISYKSTTTTSNDIHSNATSIQTHKELTIKTDCSIHSKHASVQTGQHPQSLQKKIQTTVQLDYLLYLPETYKTSKETFPLLLFLHGAGERGKNLDNVKMHGPPMLAANGKSFPFVIVSPQCPDGAWWTDAAQIDALNTLLDEVVARYRIDRDRIYVTGLSMGGYGTWQLALQFPSRFAAIAPVCGGGDPLLANRLEHLPVWVFHGEKDSVVPFKRSEEMVAALKKNGGDVRLTAYPNTDHNSWTETYNNPALYEWFLQHKLSDRK